MEEQKLLFKVTSSKSKLVGCNQGNYWLFITLPNLPYVKNNPISIN